MTTTVATSPVTRARSRLARPGRRRSARPGAWTAWTIAWLGGPVIGVANGAARELVYEERVGELTAQQLSTATGIGLLGLYFAWLDRRWPIPTARAAWTIGATWLVLTVTFEFVFGRYVRGREWSELVADYDLTKGRVWVLVPLWVATGPVLVRRLGGRRA